MGGSKYTILGSRIGTCPFPTTKRTEWFIIAAFWFVVFCVKYPQADFTKRDEYVPCSGCNADYCVKSPKCEAYAERSGSNDT